MYMFAMDATFKGAIDDIQPGPSGKSRTEVDSEVSSLFVGGLFNQKTWFVGWRTLFTML